MTIPVVARVARRGRRAAYDRVGTNDDEDYTDDDQHVSSTTTTTAIAGSDNDQLLNSSDQQGQEQQQGRTDVAAGRSGDDDSPSNNSNNKNGGEYINLVILDTAQTKFAIPNVQSNWTISKLKKVGSKIHKVSPTYQRLIYRGQMLQDEKTLKDYGIMSQKQLQQDLDTLEEPSLNTKSKKKRKNKNKKDKKDADVEEHHTLEFIIHLFPKPRVVVVDETNDETDGLKKKKKTASSGNDTDGNATADGDDDDDEEAGGTGGGGGAHIPQIILNAQEAQQRGTILVLGSAEIGEAQNNVKFLSLLLLFVCSMRLLALASIATAPDSTITTPGGYNATNHTSHHYHHYMNNTSSNSNNNAMMGPSSYYDDGGEFGPSPNGGDMDYALGGGAGGGSNGYQDEPTRPWQTSDWFDLIVSVIGFYVATLGLKATTENTLKLATSYLVGVFVTGILWNIWNIFVYAVFVRDETQWDHNASNNDSKDDHSGGGGGGGNGSCGSDEDDDEVITLSIDDYVTVAFFMVAMPMMVWVWCCVRAYQFRHLIQEAEQDAAERRLATSNVGSEQHHSDDDDEDDDEEHQPHETEDGVADNGDDGHHRLIV